MPTTGTNRNYSVGNVGDIDISARLMTLPTYFPFMREQYAEADRDLFDLYEYMSWNGGMKNSMKTRAMIGAIVPGQDGLHRVSQRGRLFMPVVLTNATISGTPGATSTYTITGSTNYNAAGTASTCWVGQTIDFPNGTSLPIRGTITAKNVSVNNAHVLTVEPIGSQTLPSISAGTSCPIGTSSAATGSNATFNTPIRNETEWYNCFQNIFDGTKITDTTAYYANRVMLDPTIDSELFSIIYPDGKIPDQRHYVLGEVLDWIRYHLKHIKNAVWFGQFDQVTTGTERNDKTEGLVPAIRNGGQNYTYIAGTATTTIMTQLCLDLDSTMLNVTEYLLYPGNQFLATYSEDFMTYANNVGVRYDFFSAAGTDNPVGIAKDFSFLPLAWGRYMFHVSTAFTPFHDPSQYGTAAFDMAGDVVGVPVGLANKADGKATQRFSILYATDGGKEAHDLVQMREVEGVRRNRFVELSRDKMNTHEQTQTMSIDSWLTTRVLDVEAFFYLQRV